MASAERTYRPGEIYSLVYVKPAGAESVLIPVKYLLI
jgi:hypothetical protein